MADLFDFNHGGAMFASWSAIARQPRRPDGRTGGAAPQRVPERPLGSLLRRLGRR